MLLDIDIWCYVHMGFHTCLFLQIFRMLHDAVKNDDAPEVRGAAVLVVTLLLQGLGQDTFTVSM